MSRDGVSFKVWNPRLRLIGLVWAALGLLLLVSAAVRLDAWLALLAASIVTTGVWWAQSGRLRVTASEVALRSFYRTRRMLPSEIDRCEARIGSAGLIYERAYPVFVLRSGREIAFSAVQWPPKHLDQAAALCREISEVIRTD